MEAGSAAEAARRAIELGVRPESVTEAALAPRAPEPVLVRLEPGYIQTIEQTGKTWKALLAVSLLLLTLGVGACSWSVMTHPNPWRHPPALAIVGGAVALAGFAGVLIARIGAWWRHG